MIVISTVQNEKNQGYGRSEQKVCEMSEILVFYEECNCVYMMVFQGTKLFPTASSILPP